MHARWAAYMSCKFYVQQQQIINNCCIIMYNIVLLSISPPHLPALAKFLRRNNTFHVMLEWKRYDGHIKGSGTLIAQLHDMSQSNF